MLRIEAGFGVLLEWGWRLGRSPRLNEFSRATLMRVVRRERFEETMDSRWGGNEIVGMV